MGFEGAVIYRNTKADGHLHLRRCQVGYSDSWRSKATAVLHGPRLLERGASLLYFMMWQGGEPLPNPEDTSGIPGRSCPEREETRTITYGAWAASGRKRIWRRPFPAECGPKVHSSRCTYILNYRSHSLYWRISKLLMRQEKNIVPLYLQWARFVVDFPSNLRTIVKV